MLANIANSWRPRRAGARSYQPVNTAAIQLELLRRLDNIHALSATGSAPAGSLLSYLEFLNAIPGGLRLGPKAIVALALIDNMFAMDELELEQRQLRRSLDANESATYDLLVRIGRKHAQMIRRGDGVRTSIAFSGSSSFVDERHCAASTL